MKTKKQVDKKKRKYIKSVFLPAVIRADVENALVVKEKVDLVKLKLQAQEDTLKKQKDKILVFLQKKKLDGIRYKTSHLFVIRENTRYPSFLEVTNDAKVRKAVPASYLHILTKFYKRLQRKVSDSLLILDEGKNKELAKRRDLYLS